MNSLAPLILLLLFMFSFSTVAYAGDSGCMASGLTSGFSTFILTPLNLMLITVAVFLFYVTALKHFGIHISKIKKILVISVISIFSLLPFFDLDHLDWRNKNVYVGFILIYTVIIFMLVRSSRAHTIKLTVIFVFIYIMTNFLSTNLLYHRIRQPLFAVYKMTLGDNAGFYNQWKDNCGRTYTLK